MSKQQLYRVLPLAEARKYEKSILCSDPAKTRDAMENAGRAIGRAIEQDYREIGDWAREPRVVVLCGKGLNTGDALVACEQLLETLPALRVRLIHTATEDGMNPLLAEVLERLRNLLGERLLEESVAGFLGNPDLSCDVLIDALYGLGFKAPLREQPAALLRRVNGAADVAMRVSIDLPSGMGESCEADTFAADFTYIPGVPKGPALDPENAPYTGRIRFLEIDPFKKAEHAVADGAHLVSPTYFRKLKKLRPSVSDKRTFGHCLILGGSREMPGALIMSVLGSLQSGAGLVTATFPSSMTERVAGTVPEAIWRPLPVQANGGLDVEAVRVVSRLLSRADSLLVGPGMAMDRSTTFAVCRIIRECPLPTVIDASALTQDILASVIGRPLTAGPVIITPHKGEFDRISGNRKPSISDEQLLEYSSRYRLITILKGSPNRISDGERIYILPSGGPVLARGGSGDILSGMLVSLMARWSDKPLEAAFSGVSWHGAAADSLARERGAIAVRTTEILPHLQKTLR